MALWDLMLVYPYAPYGYVLTDLRPAANILWTSILDSSRTPKKHGTVVWYESGHAWPDLVVRTLRPLTADAEPYPDPVIDEWLEEHGYRVVARESSHEVLRRP